MDGEEEDGQAFQARLFVNREAAQEPAGAGVDGGAGTRCLREDKSGHRESGCHLAPDQDAKTAHRSLSPPTHTRPPSSKHKSLFHMTRPWATSVSQLAATARFATPSAPPPARPTPHAISATYCGSSDRPATTSPTARITSTASAMVCVERALLLSTSTMHWARSLMVPSLDTSDTR